MNKRENLIALLKRQRFEEVPVEFSLTAHLCDEYAKKTGSIDKYNYDEYFGMPWRNVADIAVQKNDGQYMRYYDNFKEGTYIDVWGVAHQPGSEAAKHMTYMRCPLKGIDDVDEIKKYPFPQFQHGDASHQKEQVDTIHAQGLAAMGNMQMTVWEAAWYIRGMEDLMMDMMSGDPIADYIFDTVTEQAIIRAKSFAEAGVDMVFFGDDIGMQKTPMMSLDLYCEWIKPRMKKVIDAVRAINPDIIVFYHSCGFVTPFIEHLIEIGVDVLNPLQTECMDFEEIYREFGGKISFHGTIGTQSVMPFGTPEDVRREVFKNLDIAKEKGGLFAAPTHVLEPEVPWENIIAYVDACREYTETRLNK